MIGDLFDRQVPEYQAIAVIVTVLACHSPGISVAPADDKFMLELQHA